MTELRFMTEDPTNAPIASAPRNGLTIIVGDYDCGEFLMHWDPDAENGLFPGRRGFWVALDGSFTWAEHDDAGPTYWRPMKEDPQQ